MSTFKTPKSQQGLSLESHESSIVAGKDLLMVSELSRNQVLRLLHITRELKATPRQGRASQLMAGLTLGLLFEKPSTRTRVSFEVAMNQMGGQALFLSTDTIQLSRGESLADTALVLSRYLDGLVLRTFAQSTLQEWARHSTIPVINGLTDLGHPCQALADVFTISEKKGDLQGLKLTYIGDGNNIANSLLEVCALIGIEISVGCPPGYEPDQQITDWARRLALQSGTTVNITHDPHLAAKDSDVLYTDVWTSMGQEQERAQRVKVLGPYQLNDQILSVAKPDAMVMHCLPAHRGEEISTSVLDGPQSVVLDQAENRLHMQKAILTEWLSRPWS